MKESFMLALENRFPRWNGAIAIIFAASLFLLAYLMQRKHCSKLRTSAAALLYFYIFNVLVTTLLMRTPYSYYRCTLEIQFVNQIFVQKDLYALSEALLNIMMFLIPSIFLPFFFKEHEALKTLCCGLGFTLFIEITQYFTRLGELQTDDLIMNFSGCLLGVLIYFTLRLTISFFKEKIAILRCKRLHKVICRAFLFLKWHIYEIFY